MCTERSQTAEHDACCGGALTVLSWFLVILSLPWSLCLCLKVSLTRRSLQSLHATVAAVGVRARGLGAAAPLDSGKAIIFRAKAKFFGQKPAAKNEKKTLFLFIKRKERNSFC